MMAGSGGRHALLIIRRFLWGQRCYSTEGSTTTAKISRLAELDARIEKSLPKKLKVLWNHPAGIKTIHFWAPSWKWCLVFAGIADYTRPAEKLSSTQSGALFATGVVWSRYSMVIVPKNYNLFSVNFFLALTGLMQLTRIYLYHRNLKKTQSEACPMDHRVEGPPHRFGRHDKNAVRFGPPVVTEPGEGFGPPGTGPPSVEGSQHDDIK